MSTTSKPTIEAVLAPKPEARPRIYAYSINDKPHQGLLKIGQTTRDVTARVAEQLKTAAIKNYTIELDESAARNDGTIITDHEVRAAGLFGMSNPRTFVVGSRVEAAEVEPNDTPEKPMPLELEKVINGRSDKETDVDFFKFAGKKDQLVGKVQERYGYEKSRAEEEVNAFARDCKCD